MTKSEIGRKSKNKGARGEREWAMLCRENGFNDVRRTAQYCGNTGEASDCIGIKGIHQEVKRVEKLNIYNAIEQAKRDCGNNVPIVAHRKNNCEWLVTMRAEDWFNFVKAWIDD